MGTTARNRYVRLKTNYSLASPNVSQFCMARLLQYFCLPCSPLNLSSAKFFAPLVMPFLLVVTTKHSPHPTQPKKKLYVFEKMNKVRQDSQS